LPVSLRAASCTRKLRKARAVRSALDDDALVVCGKIAHCTRHMLR
jgi:hypothetical protein